RIQVRIQDPARRTTLMETEAKGPLFMAQLPPGRYLVTLTYSGQEVQREMSIPGYGAASASFEWTH
ncbi:MAG TPA: carboxypeptidase regulatory-like domain-containing protein, partial [Chromatiaceae bacterium]|nr:carboxypeptidase regulatory-like domain-containing protein [Chromatiaceae bacterium]